MMWLTFFVTFLGLVYMAPSSESLHMICEGKQANISFHYPRSNVSVALQISNRNPFYRDGKILRGGLSEDQVNRFHIQEIRENGLLVVVKIANVSRHDAGTYIAFVREDEGSEMIHVLRKGLEVEYPPGKPSCKYDLSSNSPIDTISDYWDVIKCTSDYGNMPGFIVCYQDGLPLPHATTPTWDTRTLSQKSWVRKHKRVLCCSSGLKNPKDRLCTEIKPVKEKEMTTTNSYSFSPWSGKSNTEVSISPVKLTSATNENHNVVEEDTQINHCLFWNEVHILVLLYLVLFFILIFFIANITSNISKLKEFKASIIEEIKKVLGLTTVTPAGESPRKRKSEDQDFW